MSRRLGWLFALTIVACGASPPGVARPDQHGATGPVVGPTAATPPSWGDTLRGENLADVLVDFVQGRAVPSNFSSLAQGPELALGSVYVIKARPGKTCASTSAADYEDARLPDFRTRGAACVVKIFPKALAAPSRRARWSGAATTTWVRAFTSRQRPPSSTSASASWPSVYGAGICSAASTRSPLATTP